MPPDVQEWLAAEVRDLRALVEETRGLAVDARATFIEQAETLGRMMADVVESGRLLAKHSERLLLLEARAAFESDRRAAFWRRLGVVAGLVAGAAALVGACWAMR